MRGERGEKTAIQKPLKMSKTVFSSLSQSRTLMHTHTRKRNDIHSFSSWFFVHGQLVTCSFNQ